MVKKKYFAIGLIILFIILIGGIAYYFFNAGTYLGIEYGKVGFEVDTLFLKIAVSENTTAISHIRITNLDKHDESCDINIKNIGDLIDLKETSFVLAPEQEKIIEVVFNTQNKQPGVYLGEIEITSPCKTQKIPIILEIQSKTVIFDANVNLYPQGKDVIPGQKLNANIKIFDLANFELSNVKVIYFIKSFDGRTIISETEEVAIDDRYDYSKTFDIPLNIRLGSYVFITTLKYTDSEGAQSIGTSSVFFNVAEEETVTGSSDKLIIYVIIIFGVFFFIFLGLFAYSIFYRDKLLGELQQQYKRELTKQRELIEGKVRIDYPKLKSSAEKREYKNEIEKIKKQRLEALKGIKQEKIKEFKTIKKKYKGKDLKAQLNNWKRKGYDTHVLEKNYKIPSVKSIRTKVNEWKKKGYDTSVLEKKK